MLRHFTIFFIAIFWTSISFSQTTIQKDSAEVSSMGERLFMAFENPDILEFEKTSTDKIYCLPCFDEAVLNLNDFQYLIIRQDFF